MEGADPMTDTIQIPTIPTTMKTSTARWMRLARGGAIVMVLWAIALHLTAGILIPPVAVIGLVYLAFTLFLRGERRRLGLALSIFTAVAFLGNLAVISDDLQNPESAPAFILTLLSTAGVLLALTGGLGAFFRWPAWPIRTLAVGALAVFLAGTVGSLGIAAGTGSDAALPADVQVTAQSLMWAPEDIAIDTTATGLWIENRDGIRHTFTIPELGVDVEVPAFKTRRVSIDAGPGSYRVICTVPGHETMTGTLVVTG
jgi:plastocyanin